jgi:hypothetical protein
MLTRRRVQIVLGLLWLLDGALQLQPKMFTAHFASNVIAPAAAGQPTFVSSPIHFMLHIFLLHPAVFNSFIALTQVGIGALLLWKRTVKLGLPGSIFWGLFVWYMGESLGGLFGGGASLLMGAPGAALLYSVISLGVWPTKSEDAKPAYWLAIVWAVVWLGGAALQLQSGQNTAAGLSGMITGMASGAPGWLAALDLHTANFLQHTGNWLVTLLVVLMAAIGLLALAPKWLRAAAIWIGIALSLIFWVVGQSLGGYYTGLATDPSTAPLIILLGLAVLNAERFELGLL